MYRFAKAVLNLSGQSARQVAVRQKSDLSREFHAKYGLPLLIAGVTFCTAVWAYVSTINRHYMEPVTCRQGAAQAMAGGMNSFPHCALNAGGF